MGRMRALIQHNDPKNKQFDRESLFTRPVVILYILNYSYRYIIYYDVYNILFIYVVTNSICVIAVQYCMPYIHDIILLCYIYRQLPIGLKRIAPIASRRLNIIQYNIV